MSLSTILDDIASDSRPCAEALPCATASVSLEHLTGLPAVIERSKKADQHVYFKRLVKTVLDSGPVSKTTALEVFAMLPQEVATTALLTTAATDHNHGLVEKAASNAMTNTQEAGSLVSEVLEMVVKTLETSQERIALYTHYCSSIEEHLKRLTSLAPIVIKSAEAINLLTTSIYTIASLDSYALSYPPYEGVLDAKFKTLSTNSEMLCLVHEKSVPDYFNLQNVALYVCQKAKEMTSQEQGLVSTKEHLTSYFQNALTTALTDTGVTGVVEGLAQIKQNEKLFVGEQALAANVLDCLALLV